MSGKNLKASFLIKKEIFCKKLIRLFAREEIRKMEVLEQRQQEQDSLIFDLYQDRLAESRIDRKFDLASQLDSIRNAPSYMCVDSSHNYLNILLNTPAFSYRENEFNDDAVLISWELARWEPNLKVIRQSITQNNDLLFIGDGFLRSIDTFANAKAKEKYRKGISFCIDDLGYYYDAGRPSRMEVMLNTILVDDEQKKRARKCIDKIVETHLTKYNHQPIYEPKIGRDGVPKVLVVDQSYGDMSIKKGLASDNTFAQMLACAIKENPNADIIVKTHPDTIACGGGGG